MKKGDTVHWKWGASEAEGKIEKKHTEPVKKTIKGSSVKRKASKDEPAYDIKQKNGSKVLKSESELKKAVNSQPETLFDVDSRSNVFGYQHSNQLLPIP